MKHEYVFAILLITVAFCLNKAIPELKVDVNLSQQGE